MNDYLELITHTALLQTISTDEINRNLTAGGFRTAVYGKNSIVHFVGENCFKLEIILRGRVVVERIDESGSLMTIAEFLDNDILGGNLLFSKKSLYPMNITAKQPTVILEINKDLLLKLFSDNHEFLKSYLEFISDHATILGDRIKHYVNRSIRDSIMSFIDYERKQQNSNKIKLNMSKKALAEKIGVQRTSLSRELAKMRDEGIIKFDSEYIELL